MSSSLSLIVLDGPDGFKLTFLRGRCLRVENPQCNNDGICNKLAERHSTLLIYKCVSIMSNSNVESKSRRTDLL